jgi:membrane protein YdbS with pleckstrin-like domain
MGYPRKLLNPGEQVAVDVVPHWKYLSRSVLAVAIVLAGAIVALQYQPPRWAELAIAGALVLSVLWLLARYVRWVTTSFVVTNQRLILRRGVFRRTGREILIDRLTDISYKQTVTDRLLRCGDILLESPGREGREVLVDLPHPIRIQNEICRLVSQRSGVPGGGATGGTAGPGWGGGWPAAGSYGAGPAAGPGDAMGGPVAGPLAGGSPAGGGVVAGSTAGRPIGAEPGGGAGTGSGRVYVGSGGPPPGEATAGASSEPTVVTVAEQLSQLDDLRRRGVISRREFAAKKSELLSRM